MANLVNDAFGSFKVRAHLDTAMNTQPACPLSSSEEERAGERRHFAN
jgi:hypothetical protein